MIKASNSKKQGDVGMAYAIAWFTENEYTVNVPLTDSQDYDLIVEKDGSMHRVQVKTSNFKSKYGIFLVALRTCGGNSGKVLKKFDSSKYELVFVLCGNRNIYLIPSKEILVKNVLSMGKIYEKFKISFWK